MRCYPLDSEHSLGWRSQTKSKAWAFCDKGTNTNSEPVVSYMGPLLVLVCLALRHRNTVMERMNTTRATATAEVIKMKRPLLVSYHGAFSVGQISQTWRETCITQNLKSANLWAFCLQAKLLKSTSCLFVCLWKKRRSGCSSDGYSATLSTELQEVCLLQF